MFIKKLIRVTDGFTFIELLIAMAAGLVVMGAAYQAFLAQGKIYAAQEQVTDMHQQARAALDFVVHELRMANTIVSHVPTVGNSSITYSSVLDPSQTRGFNRDSSSNTLRYVRGQSTQPLAENISSFTITRLGTLLTVTLTARTAVKDTDLGKYRTVSVTSNVRPRNL